ncbi:NAD(P)-dependent dehydrogenase (short-subunit alcohol dehydrogenase family) [Ulvibacter sp. MAR_2010_11]|uniref:SDR family oxidoreductase n=1 Tax=Ulvibacter sp. MAR_2010_11 TaxID=1250229 RepID=UPI000C2CD9FE|nr:SDR family oxidoreductase [Ulvibacter sp. MAR_2010_11]PKA84193.1 NAD(P)-dependent dehydrogenase (short-subunit alcohol dehydrogenase family) [Ulvibacter sp. MAR_2010_11]
MQNEFKNTWAVILGGSSGLGLASAKKLAVHGMNICIVHRDRKSNLEHFEKEIVEIVAQGVNVLTFNKDATAKETQMEVCAQLPKHSVGLLLHSIAKGNLKPMHGKAEEVLTKEDIDITLHAMGTSWYLWTRALINAGLFNKNARNVAFTSEGNTKVWPGYGAVSAAKVTLEALMRNMAVELAPLGITSNCIQAGTTETASFKMIPGSETLANWSKKRNPFNRLTAPEDVANAVYLLCKEEAAWINGTVIKVDGGESLR